MDNAKHTIWIKTIDLEKHLYSIVISYCLTITKESIIEGLDAVRDRVIAFKTLYDGDFNVVSDVNFNM